MSCTANPIVDRLLGTGVKRTVERMTDQLAAPAHFRPEGNKPIWETGEPIPGTPEPVAVA
jgi:hypothetical protein